MTCGLCEDDPGSSMLQWSQRWAVCPQPAPNPISIPLQFHLSSTQYANESLGPPTGPELLDKLLHFSEAHFPQI